MGFKETEVGRIPEEWNVYELKDLVQKIGSGATPRGGKKVYLQSGIPFIRSQNIYNCKFLKDGIVYINEESASKLNNVKLYKNDILLNITGDSVARCTILPEKYIGGRVNQHVAIIRSHVEILNPNFLKYYLVSDNMQAYMLSLAKMGATRAALTKGMIESFKIPTPPIKEQKAIVNILSTLDEKIKINNQINKKLEEIAQTIFKHWFLDFEFPDEDGKPYKSSGGKMVESEIGMIPKGWEVDELKEFIKFIKGKKPKNIKEIQFKNSEVYLTIDVLNRNSLLYGSKEKVVFAEKTDSLMVMDGASSGTVYYGKKGMVGSTLSKVDIINKNISSDFIYNVLKYFEENIKLNLTGSAIPHVDKDYVYRLRITKPINKNVLKKFSKIAKNIREDIIINQNQTQNLKNLRDTLLPKLMSGEIRVPLDN